MAVSSVQGSMPLYLHVVQRILRDLRIEQQQNNTTFDYREFKSRLMNEDLAAGQLGPLQQRLETLESFMVREQVVSAAWRSAKQSVSKGVDWMPRVSRL